ncbi:hypothetical protein ABH992_008106 [Bradyrhizobium yuanmingense]|uniref:Uncharacterized protein n=1 Tax=Bradyrhizobium yuanmingense TaxID=108015 RepID=A0ABV4GUT8_9BRAD
MRIGLCDRDLQAGDQIAQQRARGKADDDAGSTCGGEQADSVLLHGVERHQRGGDRDDDDDGVCDALEHAHLRDVLARDENLGDIAKVLQVARRAHVDDPDRDPADQRDEGHDEQPRQGSADRIVERRQREHHCDGGKAKRHLRGACRALDEHAQERKPRSESAVEKPCGNPVDEQGKKDRAGNQGEADEP